jgi:3D (Asp-Asp-Asp) domain-containing protein
MFNIKLYLVIFFLCSGAVRANELTLTPNIFASYRYFEYSVGRGGIDNNLYSLGLGVTATYGRLYVDVSAEKNTTSGKEPTPTGTAYFERQDAAISVGYGMNESISLFAGYKYGETRIAAPPTAIAIGSEVSLEGRGFYVGAGGGWAIYENHLLSFSAAYAHLRAQYDESMQVRRGRGDASGTSLGIRWKTHITPRLSYDLSLIRHDYYYKNFENLDFNISEQILSIRTGVSYQW